MFSVVAGLCALQYALLTRLIRSCWSKEAQTRPTTAEIVDILQVFAQIVMRVLNSQLTAWWGTGGEGTDSHEAPRAACFAITFLEISHVVAAAGPHAASAIFHGACFLWSDFV